MPEVHVSLFDEPLTVDDAEVAVLRCQGLLRAVDGVPEPGGEPAGDSKPDDTEER